MNRLILIGNGFDLAHGMKTGYNDFIKWYLTRALVVTGREFIYEDELLKVEKNNLADEIYIGGKVLTEEQLINFFYERGFEELISNQGFKTEGYQNIWHSTFFITIKSQLLSTLLMNCSLTKWVDIENEFYERLKWILPWKKAEKKQELLSDVNLSMKEIIRLLEIYLSEMPAPEIIDDYRQLMGEPIKMEDIVMPNLLHSDQLPSTIQLLNFNYTPTVQRYFNTEIANIYPNDVYCNYIHGKLFDPDNPIIFGFGDELDDDYIKIELQKTKGFFEYIKSFWYFKTSNYHNLVRFIDGEEFQVYVLGHSCGLSDRTMLNMIFEHAYCKSIKIFYHGTKNGQNNYMSITQEIARHFKNKVLMRKKIAPFDKSFPMPQASTNLKK
jgi:hypothetical protein